MDTTATGVGIAERVKSAWNRYWFGLPGFYGLAVSRVIVGVSLFFCYLDYRKDWASFLASQPLELYQPKGWLQLLGGTPPPPEFFVVCEAIGVVTLLLFVLGIRARFTGVVAAVTHLAMASITFSFQRWVEHGYNPIFLAFLALLAGDHARSLSVDWFLSASRETKARASAAGQTLALWAIVLAFFAAAYWKWRSSPDLAWAFSDNLRHQIIMRYLWTGESIPGFPAWIAAEPWRYQMAALGNLVLQIAPMGACFVLRRPRLRVLFGTVVIAELLLLDHVMALPEPRWFILAGLFIDWDDLAARIPMLQKPRLSPMAAGNTGASMWIGAFLLTYGAIALVDPALNFRLNAYPFANFRLFAELRVKKPIGEHLPYEFVAARFEAHTANPQEHSRLTAAIAKSARDYRNVYIETNAERLSQYVEQFRREAVGRNGVAALSDVRLYKTILQAPAYPQPVTLQEIRRGLAARWDARHGVRYVGVRQGVRTAETACFDFTLRGYDGLPGRVALLADLGAPAGADLAGTWVGNTFCTMASFPERFSLLVDIRDAGGLDTYLVTPFEKRNFRKAEAAQITAFLSR